MPDLPLIFTTLGIQKLRNAQGNGVSGVIIDKLGVCPNQVAITHATTVIPGEFKRIGAVAGMVVAPDTIYVAATDQSQDAYSVRTIALYLNDGTLLAAYSQAAPLIEKAAPSQAVMEFGVKLLEDLAAVVEFSGGGWTNPPASETVAGVVRLATLAQAVAGTDTSRATTPAGVKAAIAAIPATPSATTAVQGVVRLATTAEAVTGTDTVRAMTPAGVKAAIGAIPATPSATAITQGIVELATIAEVLAGTDNVRAVTPAGLQAVAEGKANLTDATFSGYVNARLEHSRGYFFIQPYGVDHDDGSRLRGYYDGINSRLLIDQVGGNGVKPRIFLNGRGYVWDETSFTPPVAATAIAQGLVELATNAEAVTGTDTIRAVTPAGVSAAIAAIPATPSATAAAQGIVELATNAEAVTGTDTVRAVTPAGVKAAIAAIPATPSATATVQGIIELATAAETVAGTDAVRAVTPATLWAFAKSLGAFNGHFRVPGTDVVVQWGIVTGMSGLGNKLITYPTTFPTACRFLTAQINNTSGDAGMDSWVQNVGTPGTASATVHVQQTSGAHPNRMDWFAIGH